MTDAVLASVPASPPLQLVTLSHGRLSFRSCGHGQTVIFLHGLLGSSKSWAFQFDHLAPRHRVLAWDAPGFGESARIPATIDAYAEALREFVLHVGRGPVSLVGHSMGGAVAACFAARCPELVLRLVLSCSHAGYGEPASAPMPSKFERRMREFDELGPVAYGAKRARDLLPPSVPVSVFDHAAGIASEINPEGLRRATRMLQRADNRPLLPKLTMPILVLTARGRWQDKVAGLEAGADDYLVKPFELEELLARLRALLRRAEGWARSVIHCEPVMLDLSAQRVTVNGDAVELTSYEYRLLEYLMLHAGQVVSKTELTEHLYEEDFDRDSNVLEVLVGRIRRKLDSTQTLNPIETLRGRGYCFRLQRSPA